MSSAQLTALGSTLAFLGFCSLIWAASWLVSDKRARRLAERSRKHVTIVDELAPTFRVEHGCDHCGITRADPPNELLRWCVTCGRPWTWTSPIAESVPTPEPDTLPDGGRAA